MKKEEERIIETIDEQGNTVNFKLFDIIDYEGQEYALLLPPDETPEDSEMVLMKLLTEGDDFLFEAIEDDEEFDKVSEFIENMDVED